MSAVPIAWLIARAAGLVAFGLLTVSTWIGLGMSTRILGPKRQKALLAWHKTLVWTGLSMLGLHALAFLFDPTLHFGPAAVLFPFAAPCTRAQSRPASGRLARADAGRVLPPA